MPERPSVSGLVPSQEEESRRQKDLERWRKRSQAIQVWRRALPIAIILIGLALAGWIGVRAVIASLSAPKATPSTEIRMLNPRFYGRDKGNHAFVVGAGAASRASPGSHTIVLTAPEVTLDSESPTPSRVAAGKGVYHEDRRVLELTDQVRVRDSNGYSFDTPQASVDTAEGIVTGDQGVQGDGPLGRIVASSYAVYDHGQRIVFRGRVHAHLDQAPRTAKGH